MSQHEHETELIAAADGSSFPAMWKRMWVWFPALAPPLTIAAVYATMAAGRGDLVAKRPQEVLGLILPAVAVLIAGLRWVIRRERFHLVLTVAAASLLCREIHFRGSHHGIYAAMAGIGLWCYLWRRSLLPAVHRTRKGRWLALAAWAYFVALLIQRRALKFLPDESKLHIQMEELAENIAHLFVIILSLV